MSIHLDDVRRWYEIVALFLLVPGLVALYQPIDCIWSQARDFELVGEDERVDSDFCDVLDRRIFMLPAQRVERAVVVQHSAFVLCDPS